MTEALDNPTARNSKNAIILTVLTAITEGHVSFQTGKSSLGPENTPNNSVSHRTFAH